MKHILSAKLKTKQASWASSLLCFAILMTTLSSVGSAANIVLLHGKHEIVPETETVHELAKYYGLGLISIDISAPLNAREVTDQLGAPGTRALIISYDALPLLNRKDVMQRIQRPGGKVVPILIFGATADSDDQLSLWSNRAISGCSPVRSDLQAVSMLVEGSPEIVGVLAGWHLPIVDSFSCQIISHDAHKSESLLTVVGSNSRSDVLTRTRSQRADIFFTPKAKLIDSSWIGQPLGISKAFSSVAPILLFLRYAAGDYAWHPVGHYANLTIDDPWLMNHTDICLISSFCTRWKEHNFHTTIAFIPWNFDRSEANVIELFRSNPDRFSISVHGNDHSHQEFSGDESASISVQSSKIRQSIARMEQFRKLTGVPYDRFMIFPHRIASEPTFVELNRYGFLGTANSLNVPSGPPFPKDPMFLLRSYTKNYGSFLSMFRYSAEEPIPELDIAIQSFLGNPLLFYGHEKLFDSGIDAFNGIADFVNKLQPETRWTGLGEIARNLYLVRKRDDGAFDVQMMSNEVVLRSQPDLAKTEFYIEGSAPAQPANMSVDVDGEPRTIAREGNSFLLKAVLGAGSKTNVRVQISNDLVLANEDVGRHGLRVLALRRLSDFRDMKLSRSVVGRDLVSAYYRHGWNLTEEHLESWKAALVVLIALALIALVVFRRRFMEVLTHRSAAR